jgi:type II secretion system protein G
MRLQKSKRGFTLIELLVVIAIIGLLSTIVMVFYGNARVKARDARRLSDLKQMQTALELYYTDDGDYPAGSGVALGTADFACLNNTGWHVAGCVDAYLGTVPTDPKAGSYVYTAASTSYTIDASLEGALSGLSGQIRVSPAGIVNNH